MDGRAFRGKYGSWAFIAGASEGLGAAFARRVAELGINVYLVARRAELLEETARQLRASCGVEVQTQALDLGAPDLLERLAHIDDRDFGLLIYNAAYATIQPFLRNSVEQLDAHLDVNCRGPLLLAHHFASRFRARARKAGEGASEAAQRASDGGERAAATCSGGMVLMSSMVGFSGVSLLGTYAASKSFLVVLGESLHHELGRLGIDVLVCVAGPTLTPGYLGSHPRYGRLLRPPEARPEQVAREALERLGSGEAVHVAGAGNRITLLVLQRLLGRRLASQLMDRTIRVIYAHRA